MNAPFVTVLIDTYNYGLYVEQAIESVLVQEFPAEQREIVVVDDGSTDDTAERLKKYGDAIRHLQKPNGGQASAFNFGFAAARGEIIATLDADDVWLPDKLRRICETFAQNPDAGPGLGAPQGEGIPPGAFPGLNPQGPAGLAPGGPGPSGIAPRPHIEDESHVQALERRLQQLEDRVEKLEAALRAKGP